MNIAPQSVPQTNIVPQIIDIERIEYKNLSRRDVRSLIFHLLYAAESHQYSESLQSIVDVFCDGYNIEIPRHCEVYSIANAVISLKDELDLEYMPLLVNWHIDRVSVCTKLILRYGIWELLHTSTDSRIVMNEAIELAKCFAEKDAHKFINGILDKVAKK